MNNVAQLHSPSLPQLDPLNVATACLFRHRWENRANAMAACIEHLMVDHDMTEHSAEVATIQAYAEIENRSQVAAVDVNATTSDVVVLRTSGGRPVVFTVADLLCVLEQARTEQRATVVNRDTRRPVVIDR